jgi:hypothetical protein
MSGVHDFQQYLLLDLAFDVEQVLNEVRQELRREQPLHPTRLEHLIRVLERATRQASEAHALTVDPSDQAGDATVSEPAEVDIARNRLRQERDPVSIDLPRLIDVAKSSHNLARAFVQAITVDEDLLETLRQTDDLDERYDALDDCYVSADGLEYPSHEAVFALIDRTSVPLLTLGWDAFGPMSSSTSYHLVTDVAGHDLVFRHDEFEGYPVQLIRPKSDSSLARDVTQAVCTELSDPAVFDPPTEIINHSPSLLGRGAVAHALYALIDRREGWHDLRGEIINDVLYPDHLQKSSGLLREALARHGEDEHWRDGPQDDEEITQQEKARLLATFMEQRYREQPA